LKRLETQTHFTKYDGSEKRNNIEHQRLQNIKVVGRFRIHLQPEYTIYDAMQVAQTTFLELVFN